ncbi:hypothetical protein UT300005_06850 [Clostridium sp. CTA-5]
MNKDDVICTCFNVTLKDVEDAIKNGAKSFEEVQEATNIGTGCGACLENAEEIVNNLLSK